MLISARVAAAFVVVFNTARKVWNNWMELSFWVAIAEVKNKEAFVVSPCIPFSGMGSGLLAPPENVTRRHCNVRKAYSLPPGGICTEL